MAVRYPGSSEWARVTSSKRVMQTQSVKTRTGAVFVASPSRAVVQWIEHVLRPAGCSVVPVQLSLLAIVNAIAAEHGPIVVLDTQMHEAAAVECLRQLVSKAPRTRVLVLGSRPDLGLVARSVAAGAWNYTVWPMATDDFLSLMTDMIENTAVSAETLFGRVRSRLPIRREPQGTYLMQDGSLLQLRDVVSRCHPIALSDKDLAGILGESIETVASLRDGIRPKITGSGGGSHLWAKSVTRRRLPPFKADTDAQDAGGKRVASPAIVFAGIGVCLIWIVMQMWAPQPPATYALSGKISFQGMPIPNGEIVFDPAGEFGQRRSARILNGRFQLEAKEGLAKDQVYIPRVYGYRLTGKKYENANMATSTEVQEQYVPGRFNGKSEMRLETNAANLTRGFNADLQ